jgi:DNA polymerase I-like protein with 3'-5' exonuclease and polymerase domains
MYGIPESEVTKEQRQIAKSANFGFLYCAQPNTFVEYVHKTTGRVVEYAEAVKIFKAWHEAYPAFKPWYGRTWDFLSEYGYVESVTGRRRHFVCGDPHPTGLDIKRSKPILKQPAWMRAAALREGVNFQVQSLAADIALIGLNKCYADGLPVNGFVHDSVTFELPERNVKGYEGDIRHAMVDWPPLYLKEHFGIHFDMPLEIEIK